MYSEFFFNSISLAARLHRKQVRYDELNTPYISHLVVTSFLLSEVTKDENILIAGLMHDVLEDVDNYFYQDLLEDTNKTIADIVYNVTEDNNLPYFRKKEKYLQRLETCDIDSLIVSIADKYHNLISIKSMRDEKKNNNQYIVIKGVLKIAKARIDKQHPYYVLVDKLDKELIKHVRTEY